MQLPLKATALLGLAALGLMTTAPALAQSAITLSSSTNYHNTGGDGNGYDANTASDTYTVNSPATFNDNAYSGLYAGGSTVTVNVNGGTFRGNTLRDLYTFSGGNITLYGNFGGPQTLAFGSGSFTGTLENDAQSQIFSYENYGTIKLVNVPSAVPEPSSVASFAIGGLGLVGLMLTARKRRMA